MIWCVFIEKSSRELVEAISGPGFRLSCFRSILSGFWAKICLCFRCSISSCCVVSEQKSPKKLGMLLCFLDVLLFFQNVKFCSRTIPVFLYVQLCHVPRDSGLLPNEKYEYKLFIAKWRMVVDSRCQPCRGRLVPHRNTVGERGPFKLVVKTFIDDGTTWNLSKLF